MSQEIEKYCPAGHSSNDFVYPDRKNYIQYGRCPLCTKQHFIQEFKTWSSSNVNIEKNIKQSQASNIYYKLQWIPYDNFQNIKYIADGGRGSVYSAKLENGIKLRWQSKLEILTSIAEGLKILRAKNLVHCDLHSGNILKFTKLCQTPDIDLDLCKLEIDLILNANNKNNKIYGLIPYIPPEVL
ncbi:hypothetical protein Glove_84g92 [Diversispora epigaea]|uniref:Protein kinase domain-containing protein n=1 Tax=Diversispora epigaea TaxID=1348612 RepID=A0A397J7G9_9GLOM|nr:hypothetical protein Glove_84g92 [Diversispora epigaea]